MLHALVGLRASIHFAGDLDVLFGFSSAVFYLRQGCCKRELKP